MVPPPDQTPWSLSSNELYGQGIDNVFNETDGKKGPGHDYSYLTQYYPAQWKAWDLKEQIDMFLAMPKGKTPQKTLWVFSFGSWDVWSLSALPVAKGKESVDAMTREIFEQVERLYTASLDLNSIAYSHSTVLKQAPHVSSNPSKSAKPQTPPDSQPLVRENAPVEESVAPASTAPQQPAPTKAAMVEEINTKDPGTFDVLIPRVLDPSLLPGWRDLRPRIPSVHSKAEQMRNAAILTTEWNDRIADRMIDWVQQAETEKNEDFHIDPPVAASTSADPVRDGFAYNLADFVIQRILERQMANGKVKDGNGLGDIENEEGYRDVRNPCLQAVDASRVKVAGPVVGDVLLNIPNDKIENDMQAPRKSSPSSSSSKGAAAAAAAAAAVKRAEFEQKPGLAYLSAAKVCEIPDDHLFYTPFALSQRAIWGIANETSDLIRSGESVRTKLSKQQ